MYLCVYMCVCVCVCVCMQRMDQFSIIDKNKGMHNKYCFKYFALFSIRKPSFTNLTDRQLFEKKSALQAVHSQH
jgi:hypothetical protein